MNKALKLLDEIEEIVNVPSVDDDVKVALIGIKLLHLISQLREEIKNLNGNKRQARWKVCGYELPCAFNIEGNLCYKQAYCKYKT